MSGEVTANKYTFTGESIPKELNTAFVTDDGRVFLDGILLVEYADEVRRRGTPDEFHQFVDGDRRFVDADWIATFLDAQRAADLLNFKRSVLKAVAQVN